MMVRMQGVVILVFFDLWCALEIMINPGAWLKVHLGYTYLVLASDIRVDSEWFKLQTFRRKAVLNDLVLFA